MYIAAMATIAASCANGEEHLTDKRGVEVTAEQNREYSYTDKKAGFWYGSTHQKDLQWYSGWNMAKKRVLADYTINIDGKALDRNEAECTVYPDRLERRWNNAKETFRMLDNLPIIYIEVETEAEQTSISLDQSLIADAYNTVDAVFFIPAEALL